MNVIRCHGILQDTQTETFLRFENPVQVTALELQSFFLERLERSEAVERLERLELAAI